MSIWIEVNPIDPQVDEQKDPKIARTVQMDNALTVADMVTCIRHYRIRGQYHLGDRWARLNYALRLLEEGEDFAIYLPDSDAYQIIEALDIGSLKPRLLPTKPAPDPESRALVRSISGGTKAYECKYFPTKIRHDPDPNLMGYAFGANWRSEAKTPIDLYATLDHARRELPWYNFVPVGRPYQSNVSEIVQILSKVRLLISLDNGIAHVARSLRTPLCLIQHLHPLERGFPKSACTYTTSTINDLVKCIASQYLVG